MFKNNKELITCEHNIQNITRVISSKKRHYLTFFSNPILSGWIEDSWRIWNKKLPTNKNPRPDSFKGELYPTYKELILILSKLFPKNWRGRNTLKDTVWIHHHSDIKMKHTTKKRKLQVNVFIDYTCRNSQQNISKLNPTIYKKDHTL